jgi:aminopeptidase
VNDPRIERLAELLVGYSLDVQPGNLVRIDGSELASPLITEVYRAVLRRGALPYANVKLTGLTEILLDEASDEQLVYVSDSEWNEMRRLDRYLFIWADENTRSLTRADPDRMQRSIAARRALAQVQHDRAERGEMSWCGVQYPTHAHAQEAEMSLREYEEFVYRACHVTGDADPADHWRSVARDVDARARELTEVRELRVVGRDTDLRLVVAGRTWTGSKGRRNMPDGEVMTGPVETGTSGVVSFNLPAVFAGREVAGVRLRFEGGRVVESEATAGEDYLNTLLDMDAGSRILGECAFGLNYEIDRFTRNTLFDEKMGGTMHFALGSSYARTGGRNTSALHWDMVLDLREEGEVYADGELIWEAGSFVREPAAATVDA